MSMAQLVIGAALGFMIAQGVLHGVRHLTTWLQRDRETPARAHVFFSRLIRYAGPVGASAALITLGAWTVADYLAARAARTAEVNSAFDPAAEDTGAADAHADDTAAAAPGPDAGPAAASAASNPDPYADPDFKVLRRPHHAGAALTLKETLVQKSEAKARAELLQDVRQHERRSQYDCEALDHVEKYLKADLDVWGFAAWQVKYFPAEAYKGAALPQCQDIKDVVDHSGLDLHSTVAQGNHH
jgi:hypothetical protein